MVTKLQEMRERRGLTIEQLAQMSYMESGCEGHMRLTIQSIETGMTLCPKPRKTYEWKSLAKALKCTIADIREEPVKVETYYCPACGEGELAEWQGTIYECTECGNMFDIEALKDEEEQ